MKICLVFTGITLLLAVSCQHKTERNVAMQQYEPIKGTFGYDLAFLSRYCETVVLSSADSMAGLIVIPGWQARVMTSTAGGAGGRSHGWINYKLIQSGDTLEHINPYGGEERFWLGPEGGPFSIYFPPYSDQIFENWAVPPPIDTREFNTLEVGATSARFGAGFRLTNYKGNVLDIQIDRTIRLLSTDDISKHFGFDLPKDIATVSYETENTLTNKGNSPWNETNGMVNIWLLAMLNPSPAATIFIPIRQGREKELGKPVVDDYFGKVPSNRLIVEPGMVFLKADGKYRSKIGIPPRRALPYACSYDSINHTLTVQWCDLPVNPAMYLNGKWGAGNDPLAGDVINAYNDGPVEDGSQMGPFFELESSSPAANLKPGESLTHRQRIFHFEGSEPDLGLISEKLTGMCLDEVKQKFSVE